MRHAFFVFLFFGIFASFLALVTQVLFLNFSLFFSVSTLSLQDLSNSASTFSMPVSVAIEEFAKLLALFAAISSLRGKNLPLNNFLAALFFGVGFSLYELFLVMSSASILLAGVIFLLHFSTTVLLLSGLRRLSDHAIFPIFSLLVAFLVHWGYNTLAQSLLLSTVSGVIISLFLLFLSYRISSYGSRSS